MMFNQVKRLLAGRLFRILCSVVIFGLCFLYVDSYSNRAHTHSISHVEEIDIESSKVQQNGTSSLKTDSVEKDKPKRSRAPEPSTIFMIMSGIGAAIARFARRSFQKFKRLFDIAVAGFGLVLSLPILAIAAVLIKLSSRGPAIYKQARVGKDGQIFNIYKLRTMIINAEDKTGAVWASEDDSRVTSIGKFLRKTHIDELPQLVNVLNGTMSIIGPRPERPEIVKKLKKYIRGYEKRIKVKPGITGLAQVWHKYDETIRDVKKKIKYDLLYIRKMCLMVDLRILLRTVFVVLTGRGAR